MFLFLNFCWSYDNTCNLMLCASLRTVGTEVKMSSEAKPSVDSLNECCTFCLTLSFHFPYFSVWCITSFRQHILCVPNVPQKVIPKYNLS